MAWAQINTHGMASLCQLAGRCNHFTQHALLQPKGTKQNAATKRQEGCGANQKEAKRKIGRLGLSHRAECSFQPHLEPIIAYGMKQQVSHW